MECLAEYDVSSNGQEFLERWFVHGPVLPDPPLIHFLRVKGPLVMVDLAYKGQTALVLVPAVLVLAPAAQGSSRRWPRVISVRTSCSEGKVLISPAS